MANTNIRDNRKRIYHVDTEKSSAVVYVNWMKARNLRGLFWMYWNVLRIFRILWRSEGLLDMHIGLSNPIKFILVTYWRDEAALRASYTDSTHVKMMRYIYEHPDDFILGNETYAAPVSTRYLNGRTGFALAEPAEAWDFDTFNQHHDNHKQFLPENN